MHHEDRSLVFTFNPDKSADLSRLMTEFQDFFTVCTLNYVHYLARIAFKATATDRMADVVSALKAADIPVAIFLPAMFVSPDATEQLIILIQGTHDSPESSISDQTPESSTTETTLPTHPQAVRERNETLASADQREPRRAIIQMITQAFFVANNMQPEGQGLSVVTLSKVTNVFKGMLIGRHPERVTKDIVCEVCRTITTAASLQQAKDELNSCGRSLQQVGKKSWPILKQAAEILLNTYSDRQS